MKRFSSRNKTRYELFEEVFTYWAKKLNVDDVSEITRDNRYNSHLITEFFSDGDIKVRYNSRCLSRWSYPLILDGVFHELGHIIIDLPYKTHGEQVESEFIAETFALKMMHKYYPHLVRDIRAYYKRKLDNKNWQRKYPIHYMVFSLIEEYKK